MFLTLSGIVTFLKLSQSAKAPSPILVTILPLIVSGISDSKSEPL